MPFPAASIPTQSTLSRSVRLDGVGVHSALPASATLHPARPGHGISFRRVDLPDKPVIPATPNHVVSTQLCTVVGKGEALVSTIEHVMAALHGMGVDNATVDVDGPEMPILDGAARAFVDAILSAGIVKQGVPRPYLKVLSPVRVEAGDAWAEFVPHEGTRYYVTIDFPSRAIGRQSIVHDLDSHAFRTAIAPARTFGSIQDVMKLRAMGYQKGSSLENSVGIDGDAVVNPEGLRFKDEFARHKALDAIGDLALAGMPFLGEFRSYKGGHGLNARALAALLADETAHSVVTGVVPMKAPVTGATRSPAAVYSADK